MGDTAVTFNHFLHKYCAVYDKWMSETEGNVNEEVTQVIFGGK